MLRLDRMLKRDFGLGRAEADWSVIDAMPGAGVAAVHLDTARSYLHITPVPHYKGISVLRIGATYLGEAPFSGYLDSTDVRITWEPAVHLVVPTDPLRVLTSTVPDSVDLGVHVVDAVSVDSLEWDVRSDTTVLRATVTGHTLHLDPHNPRFLGNQYLSLRVSDRRQPTGVADSIAFLPGDAYQDSLSLRVRIIPRGYVQDTPYRFLGQEDVPVLIDLNRLITNPYSEGPSQALWHILSADPGVSTTLDRGHGRLSVVPAPGFFGPATTTLEVTFADTLFAGVRDTALVTVDFVECFTLTLVADTLVSGSVDTLDLSAAVEGRLPSARYRRWRAAPVEAGRSVEVFPFPSDSSGTFLVAAGPDFIGMRRFVISLTDSSWTDSLLRQEGITLLARDLISTQDTLRVIVRPSSLVPPEAHWYMLQDQTIELNLLSLLERTYGHSPSEAAWRPLWRASVALDRAGVSYALTPAGLRSGVLPLTPPEGFSGTIALPIEVEFPEPDLAGFRDTVAVRLTVLPVFSLDVTSLAGYAGDSLRVALRDRLVNHDYLSPQTADQFPVTFSVAVISDSVSAAVMPGDTLVVVPLAGFVGTAKIEIRATAPIPLETEYVLTGADSLRVVHQVKARFWPRQPPPFFVDPGRARVLRDSVFTVQIDEDSERSLDLGTYVVADVAKSALLWQVGPAADPGKLDSVWVQDLSLRIDPAPDSTGGTWFVLQVADAAGRVDSARVFANVRPVTDLVLFDSLTIGADSARTLRLDDVLEPGWYSVGCRLDPQFEPRHLTVTIDAAANRMTIRPRPRWWGREVLHLQAFNAEDDSSVFVDGDSMVVIVRPQGPPAENVGSFYLIYPADGDTVSLDSLAFYWEDVEDRDLLGYHVWVSETETFDTSVYALDSPGPRITDLDWLTEQLRLLLAGRTYWWWCYAEIAGNRIHTSDGPRRFYLGSRPPPFALISPVDGVACHTREPEFSWERRADSLRIDYLFEVSADTSFTVNTDTLLYTSYIRSLLRTQGTLDLSRVSNDSVVTIDYTDTSTVTKVPFADGRYFWRVTASDSTGIPRQAGPDSFVVNVPSLAAPADSARIETSGGRGQPVFRPLQWTRYLATDRHFRNSPQVYHLHLTGLPAGTSLRSGDTTLVVTDSSGLDTVAYRFDSERVRLLVRQAGDRLDNPYVAWEVWALEDPGAAAADSFFLGRRVFDASGEKVTSIALLAPAPNDSVDCSGLHMEWTAPRGQQAVAYTVEVTDSSAFPTRGGRVYRFGPFHGTAVDLADPDQLGGRAASGPLPMDDTYLWRVQATTDLGRFISAERSFYFGCRPDTFSLIAPPDDEVLRMRRPALSWHDTGDRDGNFGGFEVQSAQRALLSGVSGFDSLCRDTLMTDPREARAYCFRAARSDLPGDGERVELALPCSLQNNSTYSWRVVAYDEAGMRRASNDTLSFVVNVPGLSAPADSARVEAADARGQPVLRPLQWTRYVASRRDLRDRPQVYHLHLTGLPTGASLHGGDTTLVVTDSSGVDTVSYRFESERVRLLVRQAGDRFGDPYVGWEVWAVEDAGAAPADSFLLGRRVFDASGEAVTSIALLSPAAHDSVDCSRLYMEWTGLTGQRAVAYTVEVTDSSAFPAPGGRVYRFGPYDNTAVDLADPAQLRRRAASGPLPMDDTYLWRVQATTDLGRFMSSERSFYFGCRPDTFSLIAPPDGEVVRMRHPTLSWHDTGDRDGNFEGFEVQAVQRALLGGVSAFDSLCRDAAATDPRNARAYCFRASRGDFSGSGSRWELALPDSLRLQNNRTYAWRVVAFDEPGMRRVSNDTLIFSVSVFEKEFPPDDYLTDHVPLFRWTQYLPRAGYQRSPRYYLHFRNEGLGRDYAVRARGLDPEELDSVPVAGAAEQDGVLTYVLPRRYAPWFEESRGPVWWQVSVAAGDSVAADDGAERVFTLVDADTSRPLIRFTSAPNPFSLSSDRSTDFVCVVGTPSSGETPQIRVSIYNLLGEPLRQLDDSMISQVQAGRGGVTMYRLRWDGSIGGGQAGVGVYVAALSITWASQRIQRLVNVAVIP
ncbi:MAG: hypothetical protein AB1505_28825 [Candidatus Latescibacterota bacterium]